MKTNDNLSKLLLVSAICAAPHLTTASPLISVGDSADIFFNGYTSLESTSNVFRDEDDEVDDVVWRLVPGFEVNFGRGASNVDLGLITRYEIRRYSEEDQLDTELFNIRAQGSYRSSRLDVSGNLGFSESKSSTGNEDANNLDDLVESDNVRGALNAEYRFSPKFSFGAGIRYSELEYKSPFDAFFADRDTTNVPLDVFYELTPKVDLSLGYVYTDSSVDAIDPGIVGRQEVSDYDQSSHFFNVGARGDLLPKLTGFFKVGYRVSDNDDRDTQPFLLGVATGPVNTISGRDDGMLGLDADLTWSVSPKLNAQIGASRDFGVGGEGESTEVTSFNSTLNYSLNSYFSATGFGRYTLKEFDDQGDRDDNEYSLGVRLNYTANEFWSFGGGYTFTENDSDDDDRDFTDHRFDITASLRY